MATPKPRPRPSSSGKRQKVTQHDVPWTEGDPTKTRSLNVPFPEPLWLQLDYLVKNRAIGSKLSFIRDAVAEAATREVEKLRRVQEAVRRIEEEDRARR